MTRLSSHFAIVAVICLGLVSCSDTDATSGPGDVEPAPSVPTDVETVASAGNVETVATIGEAEPGTIVVDVAGDTMAFDRRLLGTNLPAWIAPDRMADPRFRQQIRDMGTTVVRMPGGSWSNHYDWLACETVTGCAWDWAARPSDFAGLLDATGVEGMWTVSFNGTAEEAAALVAFFNGSVDDDRVIGVDKSGRDWGTVGQWAAMRAAGGHVDPVRVGLWEVGNEVFGAKPEAGPGCASFGWEDVWTCDGTEYVEGDADHDGFRRFREAMRAVDPTILVGAVGIGGAQSGWSDFGNEVIAGSASALDFYVVHDYGFNDSPLIGDVLSRPMQGWPDNLAPVRTALADSNPDASIPVAVTEYNLFAFNDGDTEGMMAESINAFYIADTIGQMALQGVSMANQWNLVNGETPSGSDYGIFDAVTGDANPQFYALALWSRVGDQLLTTRVGFDTASTLSAYAGRSADGKFAVLVLNKTADPIEASVHLDGSATPMTATADVMTAASLDAREVTFNGSADMPTDLAANPPTDLGLADGGQVAHTFDPYSITLLTLTPTVQG